MDGSKKAVREFILSIAAGFAAYIPVACAVALIAERFSVGVLAGAVYGSCVMLLYYFMFARAMAKAAGDEDPEAAKKRIQAAYSLRMLMLAVLMGVGVFFATDYAPFKLFHWLPVIASMIVPRLSIAGWQIAQKLKGNTDNKDGGQTNGN